MAIAEHNPSKLFKKNRGLLKMSKKQLHDFATTQTSTLPKRVGPQRESNIGDWMSNRKDGG
jgi:hypothetical protein